MPQSPSAKGTTLGYLFVARIRLKAKTVVALALLVRSISRSGKNRSRHQEARRTHARRRKTITDNISLLEYFDPQSTTS